MGLLDEVESFAARFLLVQPHGAGEDSAFSVSRRRAVGDGFHEDVTVTNHTPNPLDLELYVEAAADFAQVELNGTSPKRGGQYQVVEPDRLVLGYSRAGFVRETWITTTAPDAVVTEDGLRFVLRLEPHGEWTTCLEVLTAVQALGNAPSRVKHRHANWR